MKLFILLCVVACAHALTDNEVFIPVGNAVIEDALYIGPYTAAANEQFVFGHQITHIVDIGAVRYPRASNITYLTLVLDDSPNSDIAQFFDRSNRFIADALLRRGKVLVHCAMGISRSSSLVAAYLMQEHKMNLANALETIRKARPFVNPNHGFIKQLTVFESLLRKQEL